MTIKETREYEMLERVRKFGEAHRATFPETSEGGQAFAAVAAAASELTDYDDVKKTSEEGKQAKAIARESLLDRLRTISRTARVIAIKTPGFADRFTMPKGKATDQTVLGAGRVFADNAETVKDRFVAHGLPESFVPDLQNLVATFGDAIREREAGKEQKAVAQKGLAAALGSGLAAARALDVIVANQLGTDRDAMSAWSHDRRIAPSRRPRGTATVPSSTPLPAVIVNTVPVPIAEPVGTEAGAVSAAGVKAGAAS